jgi:hypothetical protein
MKVYGYQCKTPGCHAWIQTGNLPEDRPSAMHVLIELGADPRKVICRDCGQAHLYFYSERETLKLVSD